MLTILWLRGIITHRGLRLTAALLGVGFTVALLAVLGGFIAGAAATMTSRAISTVPVHWQVQLTTSVDEAAVRAALSQTVATSAVESFNYADSPGFVATSSGTTQTTGKGQVLGIAPGYRQLFTSQIRPLLGAADGVLVMQQTAANLHAAPGDIVTIKRIGLPNVQVTIAGVVDLPNADSLFQVVGAAAQTAPIAPPDNVLLLPQDLWHQLFDPQAVARPDTVRRQLHVQLATVLPGSPTEAYIYAQGLANNLEARLTGSVIVGNNLAARLGGVREDALYATLLFLFLGLPGAILAALLTLAVTAAGAEHRRREQALLRLRGASVAQTLRLAAVEAALLAVGGVILGLLIASVASIFTTQISSLFTPATVGWTLVAAVLGIVLAFAAILYPAARDTRQATVIGARQPVGRAHAPLWQRLGLDFVLLAVAAISFWQSANAGYKLVLAPEGVADVAVDYTAFLAPLCLWLGAGLLAMRLWYVLLGAGRPAVAVALRPLAGGLAGVVAAAFSRQRGLLTRGLALVALAFSFAISTAVFNTTYNAQALIDAQLTNGADVTVTGSATAPAGALLGQFVAQPGVAASSAMMHRFAYVGSDLQDMYGIDAAHIGGATSISNAYFANGNAAATMTALATHPDGVLVAAETVKDFQLNPGELINLRLLGADHQYHRVAFHFLGIVREFPTAPKDSFLVANADYLAQQTGVAAREVVLLRATTDPADLAARLRILVANQPGMQVSDLSAATRAIGSSLTAINLGGLTVLELSFAVLLLAGATGLVMALGLAERRRLFTLLTALGAKQWQTGAFIWGEGLLLLLGGGIVGLMLGFALAQTLVTVLTGVFDPAPESLAVPWPYLAALLIAAILATTAAVMTMGAVARRGVAEALRGL